MQLTCLTPPAVEPLTADDVKWYLRLPEETEGQHLQDLISAARSYVEGTTGRALLKQQWRLNLSPPYPKSSPLIKKESEQIKVYLPHPPILSIEEVSLKSQPTQYTSEGDKVFLSSFCWGKDISITYWAGYGNTTESLPFNLKMGTLMATRLFEFHEPVDLSLLTTFKVFHIV